MENHIKYSKAVSWFNDCRIPFVENDKPTGGFGAARIGYGNEYDYDGKCNEANTQGRFPANLLVSDDMLNDGIKPNKGHRAKSKVTGYGEFGGGKNEYHGIGEYMEVDSKSRYYDIDKWFNNLIDG
jgi:outer membrane protein assembly factor BamA